MSRISSEKRNEKDHEKLMAIYDEFESKRDELARSRKDLSLYKTLAEETIKITKKVLPKEEHEPFLEWLVATETNSGLDERRP